jgi:hypothetical protein
MWRCAVYEFKCLIYIFDTQVYVLNFFFVCDSSIMYIHMTRVCYCCSKSFIQNLITSVKVERGSKFFFMRARGIEGRRKRRRRKITERGLGKNNI